MLDNQASLKAAADSLWTAMGVLPEFDTGSAGLQRIYREKIYGALVRRCVEKVLKHRNPEPWLSARCLLQLLAGDRWNRRARRYEGLVGGETTQKEYRRMLQGRLALPVIVVAGYPRSGTTSLQTVVRVAYRPHIPEIDTADARFSLWEYPKHSPGSIKGFAEHAAENGHVLCAVREFVDSVTSLVVGRGGKDKVDLEFEKWRWEKWLDVYTHPRVSVIPFTRITSSTPRQLCGSVAHLVGVKPEFPIDESATYDDLMRRVGKGDPDSEKQSNLPSMARSRDLEEARIWVKESLGESEVTRLRDLYAKVSVPQGFN